MFLFDTVSSLQYPQYVASEVCMPAVHNFNACETCKYWVLIRDTPIDKEGWCIRYAPHPQTPTGYPQEHPVTKCYEVCGDYVKAS